MASDLVKRLRADELPGDRQRHIEARIELFGILNEAADRIEALEKALRYYAEKKPEDWVNHGADDGVIARAALEGKDGQAV